MHVPPKESLWDNNDEEPIGFTASVERAYGCCLAAIRSGTFKDLTVFADHLYTDIPAVRPDHRGMSTSAPASENQGEFHRAIA